MVLQTTQTLFRKAVQAEQEAWLQEVTWRPRFFLSKAPFLSVSSTVAQTITSVFQFMGSRETEREKKLMTSNFSYKCIPLFKIHILLTKIQLHSQSASRKSESIGLGWGSAQLCGCCQPNRTKELTLEVINSLYHSSPSIWLSLLTLHPTQETCFLSSKETNQSPFDYCTQVRVQDLAWAQLLSQVIFGSGGLCIKR